MKQLQPIEDKLVIKPKENSGRTSGGVIIPDIGQEVPTQGEVIAVGPGKLVDSGDRLPMTCKVGDIILFPKFAAAKFDFENEEYLIIREPDILAIIKSTSGITVDKKAVEDVLNSTAKEQGLKAKIIYGEKDNRDLLCYNQTK